MKGACLEGKIKAKCCPYIGELAPVNVEAWVVVFAKISNPLWALYPQSALPQLTKATN